MTAIAYGPEPELSETPSPDAFPVDVRTLLERRREALLRQAAELADDLDDLQTSTATIGQGETELATRQVGVDLRVALDARSQVVLEEIERALARLDAGTYGWCVTCGLSIGSERLAALPQVDQCIECQTRRERKGGLR